MSIPPSHENPILTTEVPAKAQEVLVQQTVNGDYLILKYAVIGLILIANLTMIGSIFLAIQNTSVPEGILAIGSASVGALSTMLVRPPSIDRIR